MRRGFIIAIGIFVSTLPAFAQTYPAGTAGSGFRLLFDSDVGTAAGLGYKFPDSNFDLAVEKPIGFRFELQGSIGFSPSKKLITNNGKSLLADTQALFWVRRRLALVGGVHFTRLWTSGFDKSATYPLAGIAIRDTWQKIDPGRFYITYEFATGCVLATQSNPCTIQSNRLQGVNLNQEFRLWPRVRVGFIAGLWHFCDQGNPEATQVPRSCHVTMTSSVVFRLEIPSGGQGRSAY